MINLSRANKRLPHIWNGSLRARPNVSTQKQLLIVLLVTSIFWIALDLLFLFYQQTFNIDLDIVVVNRHDRSRSSMKYTPPKPHIQHYLPVPRDTHVMSYDEDRGTRQHKTNISNGNSKSNLPELYPDLVMPLLGFGGYPAVLPEDLKALSKSLFNNHSFDSVLSDHISLNRHLRDMRGNQCAKKIHSYSPNLAKTSVIICFHNEALTALLRTVHSVINRTPSHLLADVILVDDASTINVLSGAAVGHIEKINQNSKKRQIITVKNRERQGLVRSRLKGAKLARGDVLTFLDSHCEVTDGWIQPLLDRIKTNRKNVVCPVIEVIDPVDFSYKETLLRDVTQVGGFTWDLFFNWKELSNEEKNERKDETSPLKSPTMAGGLFAIDKTYFNEMGSYDEGMDIWGGENLEMSFRLWMCGGRLEILPCSRVGHIFRKENSPYSFPAGVSKTLVKNFNRLAEVWMDEYKELYYRRKPVGDRDAYIGDISSRLALRKSLNCKSFKWYIENIIPDIQGADPNPPAHGQVRNNVTDMCLDSMGKKESQTKARVYRCHGQGGNQFFVLSRKGEIVFNDEICLDYSKNDDDRVEFWRCHGLGGNQEWKHDTRTGLIKHMYSKKCLVATLDDFLKVEPCQVTNSKQWWSFGNYHQKLW